MSVWLRLPSPPPPDLQQTPPRRRHRQLHPFSSRAFALCHQRPSSCSVQRFASSSSSSCPVPGSRNSLPALLLHPQRPNPGSPTPANKEARGSSSHPTAGSLSAVAQADAIAPLLAPSCVLELRRNHVLQPVQHRPASPAAHRSHPGTQPLQLGSQSLQGLAVPEPVPPPLLPDAPVRDQCRVDHPAVQLDARRSGPRQGVALRWKAAPLRGFPMLLDNAHELRPLGQHIGVFRLHWPDQWQRPQRQWLHMATLRYQAGRETQQPKLSGM